MLDFRHQTFLALCANGSFTKAAEELHITQPAVSQHLKYLEEYYNCKLYEMVGRTLKLTSQGKMLREYATTVSSDSMHLKKTMTASKTATKEFSFGATLSIGEYVMPEILSRLLSQHPEMKFSMTVANTERLLDRLNHGDLDFILVEGVFDKSEYDATLFSMERFVPVCSPLSEYAEQIIDFPELGKNRLILREKGSGTREILENILHEHNYSLHAFDRLIEIGNMAAIKQLVSRNLGVTFLFEVAAKKEIEEGLLSVIRIPAFSEEREFNFVMLKNSFFRSRYMEIFDMLTTTFLEIRS